MATIVPCLSHRNVMTSRTYNTHFIYAHMRDLVWICVSCRGPYRSQVKCTAVLYSFACYMKAVDMSSNFHIRVLTSFDLNSPVGAARFCSFFSVTTAIPVRLKTDLKHSSKCGSCKPFSK